MAVLEEVETLTPIVRWTQNRSQLDITIELSDVKDPMIQFNETSLTFHGFGHGGHGENIYNFNLEFYNKIDYKGSTYKVCDRNVTFQIHKQVKTEEWPRLLKNEQKPGWLKVDFDKWRIEDSEEEEKDDINETINKISFEQKIKNEVDKAKDDIKIYAKVCWLTLYNILQAVCFTIIFAKLVRNIINHGQNAVLYGFDDVSDLLLTCQLAAIVEILNPLFGIVKTGLFAPLIQVCCRNFILFVLILPVKSLHHSVVVYALLMSWCSVEIIRYPFYVTTLHRYNVYVIAWLRYSAWIILYPIGFTSELIIVYNSIALSEETNRWELLTLPNVFNMSFSLSNLLKFILCVYSPFALYLLKHMWILRQRKLGGKKRVKRKQQ